jgi:hypothetical protein
MLAIQERLPLVRPRTRSARRPFTPAQGREGYRFPHDVRDRLAAALAPFRNREAAFALAVFVARFWSMPGRVALPFPIDRRALAGHLELGLTEARVRGAIRVLEEVGFLDRAITSGSNYKPTEDGLHRRPIPFVFGSEYFPLFDAANKRAAAARGRQEGARRTLAPDSARPPSLPPAGARSSSPPFGGKPKSPKSKSEAEPLVIMGEIVRGGGLPPQVSVPDANLEAALERLRQGVFGQAEGRSGEGGVK